MDCGEDTSLGLREDGLKFWNANAVPSNLGFPSLEEEGKHCPGSWDLDRD